jgi:hypothetical protein
MTSEPPPTDATESAPSTDTAAPHSAQRWPARFLRALEWFLFSLPIQLRKQGGIDRHFPR